MSNLLLNYKELSELEINNIKKLVNDNEKNFTDFDADIGVIEEFYVDHVQSFMYIIQCDKGYLKDKLDFIYEYNTVDSLLETYFNVDKHEEDYHYTLIDILSNLSDYVNFVLDERDKSSHHIGLSMSAYAEGLVMFNSLWFDELDDSEKDSI